MKTILFDLIIKVKADIPDHLDSEEAAQLVASECSYSVDFAGEGIEAVETEVTGVANVREVGGETYVLPMRSIEGQCLGYFVADDSEVSQNLDEARKFDREDAIAYCKEQNDSWDHSDGAFFHIARYENS